ncbi:hypothetical protein V2J09_023476 [Rumex salicifolius]
MTDQSGHVNGTHRQDTPPLPQAKCNTVGSFTTSFINVGKYILYFTLLLILCNLAHLSLKRLSQPRIISETLVGMCLGNWGLIRNEFFKKNNYTGSRNLKFITDFGMICYMFALGLEMDPSKLLKLKRDTNIAYFGMLSTFILACSVVPFLHYPVSTITSKAFSVTLAAILSSTSSPLLARVLTDLKMGKSDIGQIAVSAAVHSELVTILILSIGYIVVRPEHNFSVRSILTTPNTNVKSHPIVYVSLLMLLQVLFAVGLGPIVMNWVNAANPHGKQMKGSHLVLSIAFMVAVGSITPMVNFSPILSAFVTGLCLPRDGRISKFMINKVNYFLGFVFYPFFFMWVGLESDFSNFEARDSAGLLRMLCFFLIGIIGKTVGAILSSLIYGFHLPESIALGLLLNAKGHLHLYLAIIAKKNNIISNSTCIGMIIASLVTIVYIPLVTLYIIERAKRRLPKQKMGLEWHDPSKELRMLLCLHGPHNVPSSITFMGISHGTSEPGLAVNATDMVELTEQIASTLAPGEGVDAVTVTDKAVNEMRQEITNALQDFMNENPVGITLRRMLALATFNTMHQDLCVLAEDSMVTLIVLPFHKALQQDRTMDTGHSGFRYVNRKMLRNAPCSVAILVDRGLGTTRQIPKVSSSPPLSVAIIFIGGKDDREALAYATRVAHHPGVRLTVIRFLLDTDAEGSTSSMAGVTRGRMVEQEEEMKLDDECFANFYEKLVARGRVAYLEKHLVNSSQAYSTLQSLEGQYSLFIVGRGGRSNSVLTVGMNDLEQCPELGPLGDILSGPTFSATASVLIIQQHNLRSKCGGNANEFQVM